MKCSCFAEEKRELIRVLIISAPLTVGYVSGTVMLATDLSFVGHLSTVSLSAMSLASTIINGSLVFTGGMIDALRVFAAQAIGAADSREIGISFLFSCCCPNSSGDSAALPDQRILLRSMSEQEEDGGVNQEIGLPEDATHEDDDDIVNEEIDNDASHQEKMQLVGIWTQTALVLVMIMTLFISVIWMFTGDIVCSFESQGAGDDAVCRLANVYGRWSILWLWPLNLMNIGRTLLESMEITLPQTLLSALFTGANFGIDHLFIVTLGLDYVGSPVATAVATALQLFLYWLLFVRVLRLHRDYWPGWTWRALRRRRVWRFLRVGLPMMATAVLYEWVFDVAILISGSLDDEGLLVAAFNVTVNLCFTLNSIFLGLSVALSIRVANELGGGRIDATKRAIRVCMLLALTLTATVSALAIALRAELGKIYSEDPAVLALVAQLVPLMVCYFALTTMSLFAQAVLEGMAKPHWITVATAIGSWVVGLPMSWLLARPAGMGLTGLWLGAIVGELIKCAVAGFVYTKTNWHHTIRRIEQMSTIEDSL